MKRTRSPFALEAGIFSVLAHTARLHILQLMREGEVCVCHIQAVLGQRQAYISQHLIALRQAGLVRSRRDGLRVYYRVTDPRILAVLDSVQGLAWPQAKRLRRPPTRWTLAPPQGRCKCPQCASTPPC